MSDTHQNHEYLSVNFYASVFLILKGAQIVGIKRSKNNSRQSIFVFREFPQREKILQQFNFAGENSPEVLVDFRKAVTAIRSLKNMLYQERT